MRVRVVIVDVARHRLRAHGVVDVVEHIELLWRASNDDRRLRALQRQDHFALKLRRRKNRHLIEARRVRAIAEKVERRLIGKIEDRRTGAAQIGDPETDLIDAMADLHRCRIDPSDAADAAEVVREVVEPGVGDIGSPQHDEENRQQRGRRDPPGHPPEHHEENHDHRADEKCREILMREIGAA
jgi:hypothetical protein